MELRIKNKRGIFFTLLAIAMLSLFLVSYTVYSLAEERKTTQRRIETMNSYIFSLEEDLQRQIYVSSFRILFLFEKNIVETSSFIQNVNASFEEAFFNGTIQGITNADIQSIMNGAKYSDIITAINEKSDKLNVNVSLAYNSLKIYQDNPWDVKVSLDINLTIEDKAGLASWQRNHEIIALVPIDGFEDPVYFMHIAVPKNIKKTPHPSVDSSNMVDHATNGYYISSSEAPSFLDRLEGKIETANPQGIEFFLNIPEIPSALPDTSIIDHEYFADPPTAGSHVQGLPSWFILDAAHCAKYGVTCS